MKFTPEPKVLNDLLYERSYTIPAYQRPYSWDCEGKTDQNNQINSMWSDLYTAFEIDMDKKDKKEEGYFFGSIVIIGNDSDRKFQVVDGQQRLTSLLLLLTSIKCFLFSAKKNADFNDAENEITDFINRIDRTIFEEGRSRTQKLKIEKSETFDYDLFLRSSLECLPLPNDDNYKILPDEDSLKDRMAVLLDILLKAQKEQKEVALRYFKNRDYFRKELEKTFLEKETGILTIESFNKLENNFYPFIARKIVVVQLRTTDFDSAYQVFEILNNRGLPLSNKDLFRNFIIQEFSKDPLSKKPVEQYWQNLERDYRLDVEFISRYIESNTGLKQKKSAFNDIQDIFKNDFKSNITNFYANIRINLIHYTNIVRKSTNNPQINNRIFCILQTGNNAITISLLMAIFRNIKEESLILNYLNTYERYALYLEIAAKKRFSSPTLYDAIKELNKGIVVPWHEFLLSDDDKKDFRTALASNYPGAKNDVARLFLARYIWAEADSINEKEDLVIFNLLYSKATLEHIIPQTIEKKTNWDTDFEDKFREDITYKLGNMTLLTQKLNSAAKNYDWSKKKKEYVITGLVMTRLIGEKEKITADYLEKRQANIVATLIKALDL